MGTVGGILWHPLFVALKPTIPWALLLMLYPMMIGLSLGLFAEIGRKPRDTILAFVLNQIVAPLIVGPLALLTASSNLKFAAGMILMGVGPLAGSAAAFAGITGSDVAVVVTDVVLTMVLAIANFDPLAAIGVAMGTPFTEMWLLILLASLFPRWKHIFDRRRAETPSLT